MEKSYKGLFDCLLGILLVILSALAITRQSLFLIRVFDTLGAILLINGIHEGYDYFFYHYQKVHFHNALILLMTAVILIFYPKIPLAFITVIFALYLTFTGIIKFISYLNYRKDHVKGRIYVLIGAVALILNGIALIYKEYFNIDIVMILIGIYGVLLGITYIFDGVYTFIPAKKKDSLKRKIRVPLPIAVSALIPSSMSRIINKKLEVAPQQFSWQNDDIDLEVFVHVSPDGFGVMGHCDLYFENEVLSYGNYDNHSTYLFDMIGDGVLFTVSDKMKYIQFCIQEDKKTIFGYGLKLTSQQKDNVRKKIQSLKDNAERWFPIACSNSHYEQDYASRLYLKTKAQFYKFKSGRFKTYFVLGTNCVLLADQIIGSAGTDIIDLNGIIAPGTYQDYLEKEFQRQNGFVISKTIYYEQKMIKET